MFTCPGNGKISAIVAAREATVHFQKYCDFFFVLFGISLDTYNSKKNANTRYAPQITKNYTKIISIQ